MKPWILLMVWPTLVLADSPKNGGIIRFEDLPSLVRARNENVQAAGSTLKAHGERTGVLARSFVPRLSAKLGAEEFKSESVASERLPYWRLEASANIWRGGRDLLESSLRESHVRSAEGDLKLEFNSELKEARKTYWQLVAAIKLVEEKREELSKNDTNLRSIKRRVAGGVASTSDTIQFELQRSILTQDLKKLELQEDILRNRLSVSVGQGEGDHLSVESGFPKPSEDIARIESFSVNKNPELRVYRERESAERIRQSQTTRWWHPRVDLYADYGLPELSDDSARAIRKERDWTIGFRASFDLSDGLDARREASASAFQADALRKRTAHRSRELSAEDHELRHDLKSLLELIRDADQDVEKAAQFVKVTESEYARGVKNGPDFLSAVEKQYEIRRRRIELYREYHETYAELMALLARDEYK